MTAMRANPQLALGTVITALLLLVALFHGFLSPYPVEQMDMMHRLAPPSARHWLGTDDFGRDLATRLAYGAATSLGIGLGTVAIAAVFGTLLGMIAGFVGGAADLLLMRIVDIVLGFPALILIMALIAALGPGAWHVVAALAAVFWTQYARLARTLTLAERERDYVAAARATGASARRILFRHMLPNMLGPLVIVATLGIGTAIVAESGLSFLGLGVQPPTPTWGWTLAFGLRYLRSDPWLSSITGLVIMLAVLGFNLLGDGLRDRLDPRTASRRGSR
jgi:peptide/nickel transport system permease protein